jgi:hypothetical protein
MAQNDLQDDKNNDEETAQRLQELLQGAFSGPPKPLKDIPTRDGKQRSPRKPQPLRKRRQRKNRAA